jgi:hypothetical protein
MDCKQFDQIVVDLARDVSVEGETSQAAVDHARNCPRCMVRLSEQRKLTLALRAVSAAASSKQAAPAAEHSLLREFRERLHASRPATAERAASPQRRGIATWQAWAMVVAAMLLVGVVAAWKLRPTAPLQPVKRVSSPPVKNKKAEGLPSTSLRDAERSRGVTVSGNDQTQTVPAVVRHGVPPPRRTAKYGALSKLTTTADETTSTEVTTRFYPLPYGSGLGLDEGWGVVRVQVPRASLESLGVPVNEGSADEMLTADVVVGQDGLARAIRVVQ